MEMEHFEDLLSQMSKPEIGELKHADALAKAIVKVKDKSAVSLWWLSIPFYLVAAFVMKSIYSPGLSVTSAFHELFNMKGYMADLFFFILPMLLIIINVINIKQLHFLYGARKKLSFVKIIFTEAFIILLSAITLIFYFYETFFS